jgi:hypothetical protein
MSRRPRMILQHWVGMFGMTEVAFVVAVGQPCSDFSHVALPDWLTAQRTERLRPGCPAIHQDEPHVLRPCSSRGTEQPRPFVRSIRPAHAAVPKIAKNTPASILRRLDCMPRVFDGHILRFRIFRRLPRRRVRDASLAGHQQGGPWSRTQVPNVQAKCRKSIRSGMLLRSVSLETTLQRSQHLANADVASSARERGRRT